MAERDARRERPPSHTPIARLPEEWTRCLVRVSDAGMKHRGGYEEWFASAESIAKIRMYEAVVERGDLEAIMAVRELNLALRHLRPHPGYSLPVLRKGQTHVAILIGNPLLVDLPWLTRPKLVE